MTKGLRKAVGRKGFAGRTKITALATLALISLAAFSSASLVSTTASNACEDCAREQGIDEQTVPILAWLCLDGMMDDLEKEFIELLAKLSSDLQFDLASRLVLDGQISESDLVAVMEVAMEAAEPTEKVAFILSFLVPDGLDEREGEFISLLATLSPEEQYKLVRELAFDGEISDVDLTELWKVLLPDQVLLSGFETETDTARWDTWAQCSLKRSELHQTEGRYSGKVAFSSGEDIFPGILLNPEALGFEDWSSFYAVGMEIYNPQDDTFPLFEIAIGDKDGSTLWISGVYGRIPLSPGMNQVKIYIEDLRNAVSLKDVEGQLVSEEQGSLDLQHINHLRLYFDPPVPVVYEGSQPNGPVLFFDNVRLIPEEVLSCTLANPATEYAKEKGVAKKAIPPISFLGLDNELDEREKEFIALVARLFPEDQYQLALAFTKDGRISQSELEEASKVPPQWAAFYLPWDDSSPSATDVSFFLDPPAGKHGFLQVKDGHFYFEDGTRIKFWGTNLDAGTIFPTHEQAEKIAARLAKFGFNIVRLHGLDREYKPLGVFDSDFPDTQHLDLEQLDRLDYLISQLKQQGIYVDMNLYVYREFTSADGVQEADELQRNGGAAPLFDKRMIELEKEYAYDLLTHYNPYTKSRYVDEPAIAFVEIINENEFFSKWYNGLLEGVVIDKGERKGIPSFYVEELTKMWNDWLLSRYGTRSELEEVWSIGAKDKRGVNLIRNGSFEEDIEGWSWVLGKGAGATFEYSSEGVDKGSLEIDIISSTGFDYDVRPYYQASEPIKKGEHYGLSFYAKTSAPGRFWVAVNRSEKPWTHYVGNTFSLSTDWQLYELSFVAPEDGPVEIVFCIGKRVGKVWLDKVEFGISPIVGLGEEEDPLSGTVERMPYSQIAKYTDARVIDQICFYKESEESYYKEMISYLRAIGLKVPLEGTNWYSALPSVWARMETDFIDDHAYWEHPEYPTKEWSPTDWFIPNKAMVNYPHESAIVKLARSPLLDKPFIVSEYNHPFPNEYASEGPLLIASYAALQDWDAIFFYDYLGWYDSSTVPQWDRRYINDYFSIFDTPPKMSQMPVASLIFRRGDVSPAQRLISLEYTAEETIEAVKVPPWSEVNMSLYLEGLPVTLPLVHRVRIGSFTAPEEKTAADYGVSIPQDVFISDTDELRWDVTDPQRGVVTINTPRTQAIVGFVEGREMEAGNLIFWPDNEFCAISATSLDNKPFSESQRLLLVAAANVANTDMEWNEERTSLSDRWGSPPILVELVKSKITLKLPSSIQEVRVRPLDETGNPQPEEYLPVTSRSALTTEGEAVKEFFFEIRPEYKTTWYIIEIR